MLFLSVQLVDILAFLLVLLGVERISYNETLNPFLRTNIEYVPISHSLLSNIIIAAIVYTVFMRMKDRQWGTALAAGVISHWPLDAIVHIPDLPLYMDSVKIGLGLWQNPTIAYTLEIALLILAGTILLKDRATIKRHLILILILTAGFTAMFLSPPAEATPAQASTMTLIIYTAFTALAYWSEQENKK